MISSAANTAFILGSAPEYPHGTIDPIEQMAAIAQRHGVPMHVDACVGGFILPFVARTAGKFRSELDPGFRTIG
jgi:glutamate/tyrosine decarboxylase-like PLP-dependent enzyme